MHPARADRTSVPEYLCYAALAAVLCGAYLVASFAGSHGELTGQALGAFGFSALRPLGLSLTLAVIALIVVRAGRRPSWSGKPLREHAPLGLLAIAGATALACFLLRSEFVNNDGLMFGGLFNQALRAGRSFGLYDEMLESFVHFQAWLVAREWFGWNVFLTYRVLSCISGGLFVLLLLEYCRLASPSRPRMLLWLCLSGGYVQLFFADVENYTLTAVLMMAYLLASMLHLRGRAPLWQPSILLAVAMAFHLVAGFLGPSLVYLWWRAWRRGERAGVMASCASCGIVIMAVVALLAWHGVPIADIYWKTHAFGLGGHVGAHLAHPSVAYYRDTMNLIMLLAPGGMLIVPLAIYRRIALDEENVQLLIASASMLLFVLVWRAQLGAYQDWNLFAAAALPWSLLVFRNVVKLNLDERRFRPLPAIGGLATLHSAAWIMTNHFCYGR